MTKAILIIIIFCQCIMLSIGSKSYAQLQTSAQDIKNMQRHIDEIKIKNPKKYQFMIERAGGNIAHCCSCHVEVKVCEGIISPTLQLPTPQIKTPKHPKKF